MIENGEVRKHKPIVVGEIWLFTIIFLGILITGLPLLRDLIYDFMGIYGGLLLETPSNFSDLHVIIGFILIFVGILHIAIHSGDKKKELLMKKPFTDFKAFLHSLFYLIGFAKREEEGGGDRYNGRQKVVYLALVYTVGLSAISGITLFMTPSDYEFISIFTLTHVLAGILIVLVLLFHLAITIRHHDSMALKCSFGTGKLPLWYIKKNHKIWYLKILNHEKKIRGQSFKLTTHKTTDPVAKALIKLYKIDGINLPGDVAEEFAKNFRKSNKQKDIERLVEISKTI